jgi:hypothetical protein
MTLLLPKRSYGRGHDFGTWLSDDEIKIQIDEIACLSIKWEVRKYI